jgi:hypothetical protein
VREIFALRVLRDAGFDARYHILADALFKTDIWIGDACISVFVGNEKYMARDGLKAGIAVGRKHPSERFLNTPPFRCIPFEFPRDPKYGEVYLPNAEEFVVVVADGLSASV